MSRIENVASIVDLLAKGGIALLVAIGGFFFKDIYEDIQSLKEINAVKASQIAVLEIRTETVDKKLDQIDKKIDRIWDSIRK